MFGLGFGVWGLGFRAAGPLKTTEAFRAKRVLDESEMTSALRPAKAVPSYAEAGIFR